MAVINRSTEPVDFAIDANDGYLTSKGYFDMRPSDAEPTDGGAWITVPERVTIAAGATSVVPVTVSIPRNATPGDHPAGVTASLETVSGQVRVQNRVGVRLNIRVTGDYVAKVAVTGVRAEYAGSWNPFAAGSVEVTYTVANEGNVRLVTDNHVLTSTLAGRAAGTTRPRPGPGSSCRAAAARLSRGCPARGRWDPSARPSWRSPRPRASRFPASPPSGRRSAPRCGRCPGRSSAPSPSSSSPSSPSG
ncbi:hypothetical protein ACFSTC_38170 [Nonomuraea ferruginea]